MVGIWILSLSLFLGSTIVSGEMTPQIVFDLLSQRIDSIETDRLRHIKQAVNDAVEVRLTHLVLDIDVKLENMKRETKLNFDQLQTEIANISRHMDNQNIDAKIAKFTKKKLKRIRNTLKGNMSIFHATFAASDQRTVDELKRLKGQLKTSYEDLANKIKEQQTTLLEAIEVLLNETRQDITAQTIALSISKANQLKFTKLYNTIATVQKEKEVLAEGQAPVMTISCSVSDFVVIADNSSGAIYCKDSASRRYVPAFNLTQLADAMSIDYDPVEERIYWSESSLKNRNISSSYINGTGFRVEQSLFPWPGRPSSLAVDAGSRMVYYTLIYPLPGDGVIAVFRMGTILHKSIINTQIQEPRAIALDPTNRKIYWANRPPGSTSQIETANYDGSNRQSIIDTRLRNWVRAIAVDSAGGMIYWTNEVSGYEGIIECVKTDGSGRHRIIPDVYLTFLYVNSRIALHGTTLFYVVGNNSVLSTKDDDHSTLMSVPITEGMSLKSSRVGPTAPGRVSALYMYHHDVSPQGHACADQTNGCSHFCLPHSNYFKCACATGYVLLSDGRTCSLESDFMLIANEHVEKIVRMEIESIAVVSRISTQTKNAIAIGYDQVEGRIYWVDFEQKQIKSINIKDTTDIRVDYQLNQLNQTWICIAVDYASRLVYYTASIEGGNSVIGVFRMNTSLHKIIISTSIKEPTAIVLDPIKGKLYWADSQLHKIEMANYDGSNRKSIINTHLDTVLGLTLDSAGGMIYWTNVTDSDEGMKESDKPNDGAYGAAFHDIILQKTGFALHGMIEGARINGSGRHTILQDIIRPSTGLALHGTTLYFTFWSAWTGHAVESTLMSVPITGNNSMRIEQIFFGANTALYVHRGDLYPQGLACSDNVGGCSQFCFPMSRKKLKCACATGHDLQSDGRTCL